MISRTGLKGLAAATMVVDHVGVVLLPQLWLLRCVGRLAFPIYAFFLAQGFRYTKSQARYLARLAGFALLSEIPFDYMVYGQAFAWQGQNVMFTLTLALLALACLEKGGWWMAGAVACCLAAEALRTDYGSFGVLLPVTSFYLWPRGKGLWALVFLAMCWLWEFAPIPGTPVPMEALGVAAALPLALYHGGRGTEGPVVRWGFYAVYPLHMGVLALIAGLA
ncbi:MAG TPA: hypothetical protein IAB92_00390 [Candidatus Faecousia faecigallinarum]|nr:hypothetical protein [Candidatus Faecousia faecigallinarum]